MISVRITEAHGAAYSVVGRARQGDFVNNEEQRERIESGYASMSLFIWCIALASMLFAQSRSHSLGRLDADWIFVVAGSLIMLATFLDIRSGTSTLALSKFKRSDDSTGFWTSVSISGLLGVILVLGALGDLSGLWRF
jgi:hypothetical protein